jgi:Zn finger protein HypA/HybF involved in hydrogenase expression
MLEKFSYLDKFGTLGGIFAAFAAATPCCLPLLATVGASLGFGLLTPYQSISEWVFQGFTLLALLGIFVAFYRHKQLLPLIVMLGAVAAILAYYYVFRQPVLVYGGLAGLLLASILNHRASKQCKVCTPHQTTAVIVKSVITCPHCGTAKTEIMPTDSCLFFYECAGCHKMLRPKAGHCCVFCSFGSVPCPPIQQQAGCCV